MLPRYDNLPISGIFLFETKARYLLNMSRMYNPFLPMDNFLIENLPVFAYFSTMVSSREMVSMYRSPPILISFSTFTENIVANIEWTYGDFYLINKRFLLFFTANNYIGHVVDMFPTPNWWKLRFGGKKALQHIATHIHGADNGIIIWVTHSGTLFSWKIKKYSFLFTIKVISFKWIKYQVNLFWKYGIGRWF